MAEKINAAQPFYSGSTFDRFMRNITAREKPLRHREMTIAALPQLKIHVIFIV